MPSLFHHGRNDSKGPLFRGRPSKFGEIWRPEKIEEVLQLFSRGASVDEVAACLGISRTTLYDWISAPDKAEFKAIIQTGVQLAEAWWDRQGREGLTREGFNARLWEINMRNRYAWLGFGDGQLEGIAALRARHRSEGESVRETVDVAAIIRAFEQKKSG